MRGLLYRLERSANHIWSVKDRNAPSPSQRLVRSLALSYFVVIVVGCGSAVKDGETPRAADAVPGVVGDPPNSPSKSPPKSPPTGPPAEAAAPATNSRVGAPTAEQIARWTPAPFEPVQLLAIREWEKTSFTGRLAPTPDGKHFIAAGSRVVLWSVAEEAPEHVFLELTDADKDRDILALAVSPDGRWFAVGDSQGMVRIWSLDDRKEIVAKQLGPTGIQWLAISPDSQEIATISYVSEVTTWSAAALEQRNKFKVNTNGLKRIEYLAPNMLAAAGESTSLWNTSTGALVRELSPGRYCFALARSPDGTRFIFGGDDSLHLWNIAESKQEAEITQGVSGGELLAFSPDGKFLATSNGGSVELWSLAERRAVQVIDGFGWAVVGVSWLPETNLLAVASDIGCTRLWGTPGEGAAVGLKPLHAPVAMPEAASNAPATLPQLQQMIDLRTFPRIPGSVPSVVDASNFSCLAPVASDEAKTFYQYFLEQAGWTVVEIPTANPASLDFRKNGFMISVHCYDADGGKTDVMMHHAGNYDARWTPKFDAAPIEHVHDSEYSVMYRTKADLVQIETTLLRKLHAEGWTGYSRLKSSHSEQVDARDLNFLRDGTTLHVSVGRVKTDTASTTIQSSAFINNSSAPVPPDAGFVEFDGSTEPALVATTAMTLDEARRFYDNELAAQGWLIRELGRSLTEDQHWLTYIRGQCDLTIGLTKLPDGRTLVRVGDTGGSLWELSQAKEKPASPTDAVGLEAADFPVLNASKAAAFDMLDEHIEVTMDVATLAAAAEQYTEAFTALGWTPEEGGIRAEDYTFLTFNKDDKELELRARVEDGKAVVGFRGDGLLWKKELPGGKPIYSYETWLRQNKHPPGLALLDRYEAEMRAIGAPPVTTPAE